MIDNTINDAVTIAGGEGALLANRYRIVRQLGRGGMGNVWLVEDTQLDNKPFAVKMLPSILVANKRAYRQLKDEALVAMRLVHPNIVQIRAFEENNGNPFLVMDYIDGQTLDDYLAEHTGTTGVSPVATATSAALPGRAGAPRPPQGGLSEAKVLRILRPIAAALDYAHGEGVVHRDVKPANVMIRKDGHPFILDFGIAREIQETMTRMTGKFSSGTLLYMSPEQLNGALPKPAQDVYSFAAMVYECLKGEPPFVRGAIEDQIKNKQPESPPGGTQLVASVMAGLAKKPEDRPPTCAAVLGGNGSSHKEHKERKEAGGARSRATAAILSVVALLALGGVIWYRNTTQRQELSRESAIAVQQAAARQQEEEKAKRAEEAARKKAREEQQARQKSAEEEEARRGEEESREKDAVAGIRIESKIQKSKVGRISVEDGFKQKIDETDEWFIKGETLYEDQKWHAAAVAYSNYVDGCNALVSLDGERQRAVAKRSEVQASFKKAEEAGAKTYAKDSWNAAVKTWNAAAAEFTRMGFATSAETFANALREFEDCAMVARNNKQIADEKRAEEKRQAEARAAEERRREELAQQKEEDISREKMEAERSAREMSPREMQNITAFPFEQDPNYERCSDVVFAPVYFPKDMGDRQLVMSERPKINAVAQHLLNNPDRVLIVTGHCDEGVSNELGLSVGEHYACIIRDDLVSAGINGKRIQTRSYGSEKPAVIGSNVRTFVMNNRGEFDVFRRKTSQQVVDNKTGTINENTSSIELRTVTVSSKIRSIDKHSSDGDFAELAPADMMYLLFQASAQDDVALVAKVACTETFKLLTEEQLKNDYQQFKPESQDLRFFMGEIMKVASIRQHIVDESNAKVEIVASKENVERVMRSFRDRNKEKPSEFRMILGCKKMDGRWRVAAFPD